MHHTRTLSFSFGGGAKRIKWPSRHFFPTSLSKKINPALNLKKQICLFFAAERSVGPPRTPLKIISKNGRVFLFVCFRDVKAGSVVVPSILWGEEQDAALHSLPVLP